MVEIQLGVLIRWLWQTCTWVTSQFKNTGYLKCKSKHRLEIAEAKFDGERKSVAHGLLPPEPYNRIQPSNIYVFQLYLLEYLFTPRAKQPSTALKHFYFICKCIFYAYFFSSSLFVCVFVNILKPQCHPAKPGSKTLVLYQI